MIIAAHTDQPAKPTPQVGTILHELWHGVWTVLTASPWLALVLAVALVVSVTRFVRSVIHTGPRDPLRRFTAEQRRTIFLHAGGRCEHHSRIFGRCRVTEKLEADHIHPHSRGGWTEIRNGQALCHSHNRTKRAAVPFEYQLRALAKRRSRYFPAGVPTVVTRHARAERRATRRATVA
jgi:5-methylcytosine-specific restriction endonuclease McrA